MTGNEGFDKTATPIARGEPISDLHTAALNKVIDSLTDQPTYSSNCCVCLSRPLLKALAAELYDGTLTLSVGCGSGLLEMLLLQTAKLNIVGVEISSCPNLFLPSSRFVRVQTTTSLYDEAMLASAIMFVYPRSVDLIIQYLNSFAGGAWSKLVVICPRDEWDDLKERLGMFITHIRIMSGLGFANHEIVAIATVKDVRPLS